MSVEQISSNIAIEALQKRLREEREDVATIKKALVEVKETKDGLDHELIVSEKNVQTILAAIATLNAGG